MGKDNTGNISELSRRTLLKRSAVIVLAGGAAIAAPYLLSRHKSKNNKQLVFVGFGGSLQKAYELHVFAPFTTDTGIDVVSTSGVDVAKLKVQVMSGQVNWDLISFPGAEGVAAEQQNLLEPLDTSVHPKNTDVFIPGRRSCLPLSYYWGGVAYNPAKFSSDKVPEYWREFWNVEAFPGRRALRDHVEEMLEVALMADGVPSHALYPLDVDRAFRSLDKIKPYVVKFVKQTQQTISLVQTDEVDFSYTTAARVGGAKLSGIPLAFQTKQPFITPNYLGIPRGSSRKAEATRLLQYFMKPEIQVALANELPGFGVNSKIAMSMLSPDLKKALPDISSSDTAFANMDWWAGNYEAVSKRWNEWMLAK